MSTAVRQSPGGQGPGVALHAPWRPLMLSLVLVAAVAMTFANALRNEFVFDDYLLIVDNPRVRAPLSVAAPGPMYRPLRTLSYRLDHAIGGMDPRVFHLSNVVYHGATVLLVCAVLAALGASPWAATAGALIFAVHPVQTDAVTYASGRRDVLCGLFFAAGFLAYLRARAGGSVLAALGAIAAFVLAILAKEMAATLPLVCLLYERFRLRRHGMERDPARAPAGASSSRRLQVRALVWIVVLGVAGALAFWTAYAWHVQRVMADTAWHGGSIGANFATVARVWMHYLALVLWPAHLSADYSPQAFPLSASALDPRALAAAGVLAALAIVAWWRWRRGGLAGFGAAWCAVTLLPVSHLIPYQELLAEHYLYIPMMGVACVVAEIVDAGAPARRRWLAAAVALVVAVAAGRTIVRNRDWHDPLSLWSATATTVPNCVRARFNLGQAYFERARLGDAEREWLAADRLRPHDARTELALASLYYRLGRYDVAEERVQAALALRPGDPDATTVAGWIALHSGNPSRAIELFEMVMERHGAGAEGARLGWSHAARALAPSSQGVIKQPGRHGAKP